ISDPTDPGQPGEPQQPPATTEPPAPQQHTLTVTGGSVVATCTAGGDAELLSWTPTKPYKVKDVDPGPSDAPSVQFKHGNRVSTATVTCAAGVPSASAD
ncbi:MAG TPA: hypothetical protein VFO77_05130, partial [Actinoplanes sp.]|nr:hypothetical protein [Actinoplanes sp.]